MSPLQDAWASNGGVRLHFLASGSADTGLTSLVFVPGAFGSAEQYENELASFAPRRCVAISLRGRGKSDAPRSGYTLQDHASDIAAVVDKAGLSHFVLMAYSMGVPYAICYSSQGRAHLAGMIIADYPARQHKLTDEWAAQVRRSLSEDVAKPHVIEALQQDSSEFELWDSLDLIECPVLILHGAQEGALLSSELANRYRVHLPHAEVVEFPESGHELWRPSYEKFSSTIKDFLRSIDGE